MISLKKYLDMDVTVPYQDDSEHSELLSATLECYRSALQAMGRSGSQACSGFSSELEQKLVELGNRLCGDVTLPLVAETEKQVEEQLQDWAGRCSEYFKGKAGEVKELLLVLTRTAQSVAERDQSCAHQFNEVTARLQTIANLEDLTQARASLLQVAAELKTRVDKMVQDSQKSVAQLRAEVSTYESKLKAAEELALRDTLTGLANRRSVEDRIQWQIARQQAFCVMILDLNGLKQINDNYGHLAGDNLLKQFSQELRSNIRATDVAGRWGGDEFILVLECDLSGANPQIERIRKWACGKYTLPLGEGGKKAEVDVSASIGVAQWLPGQTRQQLIEQADAAMYKEKHLAKGAKA